MIELPIGDRQFPAPLRPVTYRRCPQMHQHRRRLEKFTQQLRIERGESSYRADPDLTELSRSRLAYAEDRRPAGQTFSL